MLCQSRGANNRQRLKIQGKREQFLDVGRSYRAHGMTWLPIGLTLPLDCTCPQVSGIMVVQEVVQDWQKLGFDFQAPFEVFEQGQSVIL